MTDWLFDTFIYTGLLIAAVLLLRRPAARHFGPQVAYALWALPLVRLLMPPIVLPARFAPAAPIPIEEPAMIYLTATPDVAGGGHVQPIYSVGVEMADFLLPFWLGGAALFLAWRAHDYLRMRRDLLEEARPVGEAGNIRLVETPAVASPIAFGVSDKVVALPPDFMALHDLETRDLAIAHELAHHRGYDLLANIAAQPLLALHWFNPLAWYGWRAMRRDQEAACDARVVAGREKSERAAYAHVIAGFAAGPRLALAAPMACPVLGEKSIIHRLRSLTMSEIPSGRKKLGIAAIATTALAALPLTASISYAQNDAPKAPETPTFIQRAATPTAPLQPVPPSIESIDPDNAHGVMGENGDVKDEHNSAGRRDFTDEAEMDRMFGELGNEFEHTDGLDKGHMELAMADADRALADGRRAIAVAQRNMPSIEVNCDGQQMVQQRVLEGGQQITIICPAAAQKQAQSALYHARRAIAVSRDLPAEERERIVRELEEEIERLENREVSRVTRTRVRVQAVQAIRVSKPHVPAIPALRTSSAQIRGWAPELEEAEMDEDCEEGRPDGYSA